MATPLRNILTSFHGREAGLANDRTMIVRGQVDGALITNAAGAANVSTVTIQMQNNEGANVAIACMSDVWISDAATGIGISTHANTSEITVGTGSLMGINVATKSWTIQSDATGKIVASITDTGKNATFVACTTPHRAAISVAAAALAYG